jgi:hypothetical protein
MGIKDFPAYKVNPFTPVLIENRVVKAKTKRMKIVNEDTGELSRMVSETPEFVAKYDRLRYIKLFTGSAGMLADLNTRGVALFAYVMEHLPPGGKAVYINKAKINKLERYRSLRGVGYYAGICDLISHGVLARVEGEPNTFFINPNVVFSGDRTKIKADETY